MPEEVQAGGRVHTAGVLQVALSPKSPGTPGLTRPDRCLCLCRDKAAVGKPKRQTAGPAPGHLGPGSHSKWSKRGEESESAARAPSRARSGCGHGGRASVGDRSSGEVTAELDAEVEGNAQCAGQTKAGMLPTGVTASAEVWTAGLGGGGGGGSPGGVPRAPAHPPEGEGKMWRP